MAKEYVIICTDRLSTQNTFLFWAKNGKGYTSDIDEAGVWDKIPEWDAKDIIIEKKELLKQYTPKRTVAGSLTGLKIYHEKITKEKQENCPHKNIKEIPRGRGCGFNFHRDKCVDCGAWTSEPYPVD